MRCSSGVNFLIITSMISPVLYKSNGFGFSPTISAEGNKASTPGNMQCESAPETEYPSPPLLKSPGTIILGL